MITNEPYEQNGIDLSGSKITAEIIADERFGQDITVYNNYVAIRNSASSNTNTNPRYDSETRIDIFKVDSSGAFIKQTSLPNRDSSGVITDNIGPGFSSTMGFGSSISMYGDYLAVGAKYVKDSSDSNISFSGRVYIYKKDTNAETWSLYGDPLYDINDGEIDDMQFGNVLELHGDYLAVGTLIERVYMFKNNNNNNSFEMQNVNLYGRHYFSTSANSNTNTVNNYSKYGRTLSLYEDKLIVGQTGISSNKGDVHAYIKDSNGEEWTESTITKPSEIDTNGDQFGLAISIYGNYAAISAKGYDKSSTELNYGAVYIYKYNNSGNSWNVTNYRLIHTDSTLGNVNDPDFFGHKLKMYKNFLVVGAPDIDVDDSTEFKPNRGRSYIFTKENNEDLWIQRYILYTSNTNDHDRFGDTIGINDDYIFIGSPGDNDPLESNAGAVYYLDISNVTNLGRENYSEWSQTQVIMDETITSNENFGKDISVYGDYMVINKDQRETNNIKVVPVYKKDLSGNWNFYQNLIRPSEAGTANASNFGHNSDIYEDTIVIGEILTSSNPSTNHSKVFVYRKDSSDNWNIESTIQTIDISNNNGLDRMNFAHSISLYENTLLISADDATVNGIDKVGVVEVWVRDQNNNWSHQQDLVHSDISNNDDFGGGNGYTNAYNTIDLYENIAVIACPEKKDSNNKEVGGVYIFERDSNSSWNQIQKIENPTIGNSNGVSVNFANSVSIYNDTLIICWGSIYVYTKNNNGTWDYDQLIVASRISESHYHTKAKIYNNKIYANSINTSIDVVGTDGTIDSVGSVTVYSKNGNKWLHEKVLHRNDSDDHNGQSVDYFGRLFDVYEGGIAITSERAEHSDNTIVEAGKVYIFNNSYSSTGENGGDGEDGGDNLISAAICFLGKSISRNRSG